MSKTKYRRKYVTLTCKCGFQFERQLRRVILGHLTCRSCKIKSVYRFKYWTTDKLKEVIRNDGRTDKGGDYEQYLDGIKEILWEREDLLMERKLKQREDYE